MLNHSTLHFLEQLAQNNNKPWFDDHKKDYESAKQDMEHFVGELIAGFKETEPAFVNLLAKDCVMRIYRDVRFSKDKSPYKNNFGAALSKGGKKMAGAGYYIHIEPNQSFIGGGIWQPEAALLKSIRQEIDYNFKDFTDIVESEGFHNLLGNVQGDQLVSVPKGFDKEHPAANYLKLKSFTVSRTFTDNELCSENMVALTVNIFKTMKPFIDFLNKSLD